MPTSLPTHLVMSYLDLRKSIGYIGLLLPLALWVTNYFMSGATNILDSISAYYHSSARNVFVAALAAIAVFAFAYRGYDWQDNLAGDIVALACLGVAFFPTSTANPNPDANPIIGLIHILAAITFFLTIAYFCLVLFPKTKPGIPMTVQKRVRNKIYKASGWVIIACLFGFALYRYYLQSRVVALQDYQPVFWLETLALVAFGLAWLTKGEAIMADKSQ